MKKILEGSRAIAETIKNIGPEVVSAYPITPQTHIVEALAEMKANGEAGFEYVRAESEFAAISIVLGASATGSRVYTATSSQGLLLMTEVLFNVAGLRLPIVMTDANRAVGAPINIWNDQQDAMVARDTGWLMWFGEDIQEVCDLHLLAYQVAEKCQLPVMVNLDGFVLTHVVEPVIVEEAKKIKKFLPPFKPTEFLNINKPLTFGAFATPEHYFEFRQELHEDVVASLETMKQGMQKFKKVFGRSLSLVEYYGDKNAEIVLVAMGSVIGTMKEAVDRLRRQGKKIGLLKVVSFRPWPEAEIAAALAGAKYVGVIDKSLSLGAEGILATEIRRTLGDSKKIISYVAGLGGRDITMEMIENIFNGLKKEKSKVVFVGR